MNYELAKQLKDAGFDQREDLLLSADDVNYIIKLPRPGLSLMREDVGQHKTFDYSIYPYPEPDDWTQGNAKKSCIFSSEFLNSEEGKKYTVYFPTLSELIEACGDKFGGLHRMADGEWLCFMFDIEDSTRQVEVKNKTPEEAVAHLYLSMQKN